MSGPKRIPTDGAQRFGHNPFDALSSEGLPSASESPTEASAQPNAAETKPARKNRGRVDIIRQKAGRGGKTVTVVTGFVGIGLPEKEQLAQLMQKACGTGGTVKEGRIEIQGDKRAEVARILTEANFDQYSQAGKPGELMAIIGKRNVLSVIRESAPGLYLDGGELGEILLPGRYIPRDLAQKDKLDVFIYRDSEDRLIATTEIPHAMVGEFAYLKVISVNRQIGAFLDWGLAKDLLLPFREQDIPVRVGQRIIVCVYLDPKTDRIVATTRLNRHLSRDAPNYREGQPVNLLVTGSTPLGYNAIVENAHRGLLYHNKLAVPLETGQKLKGFVRTIRPGGKIDLSLDASGYRRVATLTDQIVQALERNGGRLEFDDDSSPEVIRRTFAASKKAFKQALGKLYKMRRIRFQHPGIQLHPLPLPSEGRGIEGEG